MVGEVIGSTLFEGLEETGIKAALIIGKKTFQAGRYYVSEVMRDPRLQQKKLIMLSKG